MELLPQPQKILETEGQYFMDYRRNIVISAGCGQNVFLYAKMLSATVEKWCGLDIAVLRGKADEGDILLKVDASLKKSGDEPEKYTLSVKPNGVCVTGSNEELLLNGIQTLRQMCVQTGGILPCVEIEDFADIPNRGFYHDATRGRVPKLEELKKLVDIMCYYKMNQLQLYVEHTYLFKDLSEMWRDETPLTAQEIMELDQYCQERHIDLVPSLSSFGHLYKLLRTKSYEVCCELEGTSNRPFSFQERMAHHTVNVSNPDATVLIKSMIEEYMNLFSSKYFNICADETFDLCKGRSSHMVQDRDVKDVYTDYVRELSEFLIAKGKIPMFWGDILWNSPEKIKDLPKENICLNWGYAAKQGETETKRIAEAGAVQYTCPGAGGWNEWVNLFENAYENIKRMCSYAVKYHAVGVLNTDWGDFGHINQPEFSRPSLIYGAAFSWNKEILDYKEVNQRISILEFGDTSGEIMSALSEIADKQSFGWREVVMFRDGETLQKPEEERRELLFLAPLDKVEENCQALTKIRGKVQKAFTKVSPENRILLHKYLLGIDGTLLWNRVKPVVAKSVYGEGEYKEDPCKLAKELEEWFMKYKDEWRKISKEGDLGHISEVVFYYADLLRETGKKSDK